MKTLTRKEFDKIVSNYITSETEGINEHNEIREILKKVDGKPINGKTLNKKLLGENFTFTESFGMFYIKGAKYDHLIGYANTENIVSIEETTYSRGFEYFDNCCGGAALQRIKQIENTDKDKAFKLFSKLSKTFNELRLIFGDIESQKLGSFYFSPYHAILKAIYSDESKFKLTDFYYIRETRE